MAPPSGMRAVTRRVAGSIRSRVWESLSSSHTDPNPATIWSRPPAGESFATIFGPAGAMSLVRRLARP